MRSSEIRLMAACVLFLAACSGKSAPKQPPFEGRWSWERSSEVENSRITKDVSVWSDGKRFRVEEKTKEEAYAQAPFESLYVRVFDGETLWEKKTRLTAAYEGDPLEPESGSSKPLDNDLGTIKFWTKSGFGDSAPGGRIAGRDTLLWQRKVSRPDADETTQLWTDPKTGLALRSNLALFSKQADQVMWKEAFDCLSLTLGPVDPKRFEKP